MSLSILHNASAAVANRLLSSNDSAVGGSVAKLSAGTRVLAAKDDAAALAIGSRLKAEVASLTQASVNAGQAAAMLQIADGAAAQIDTILTRMKVLASQAGSGQISDVERGMLDTEFQTLTGELDRIAKSTDFNNRSLLEGDVDDGVVFTVRSEVSNGTLKLGDRTLELGDSFSQADMVAGRVTYTHDGTATTSDRLIVSVANSNGDVIGVQTGELDQNSFKTDEYAISTGLDNIQVEAAYARGATGQGIKVAVIDSGIDIDHADLVDNIVGAVDIQDGVANGLSHTFAGGTFVGAAGEVSAISLVNFSDGVDLFESGNVPTLNVTGNASAATVTLRQGGVDFQAVVNVNTGGVSQTLGFTLTEVNGTRTIDIGLTSDINGAGAITSAGATLVSFTTATTGNGNDTDGHGTHVSGIIAASKNGLGVHGVAHDATLLAINADNAGFDYNDVADAIDYAVSQGADVINMSLGTDGFFTHAPLQAAITRAVNAGVILVAAAGNSSLPDPAFPANLAINDEAKGMLFAVVATDDNEAIASFSNQAGNLVLHRVVSAPGDSIVSTTNDGATGTQSGTSMAAPMVSGAIALLKSKYADLSGEEIASLMFTSTQDLGTTGVDSVFGQGLIDLDKATASQISLSFNISGTTTVDGAVNLAAESTVAIDRALLDYTNAYEGRVDVADRGFTYKIGTGVGSEDTLDVSIGSLTANALGVDRLSVTTAAAADAANAAIDLALDQVVATRASIGASQNRLDIAINNLATTSQNTEAARSQLLDLDIARGMIEFTSRQILTQASISMVSQANQQSQLLLRLLN